jgi:hypothetical protein
MTTPGYGENGGVIGPQNTPSSNSASGIWSMAEVAEAERQGIWAGFPFAATGGTESTYSAGALNYKVHTFNSSGTFVVTSLGDGADLLVIAGGAGSHMGTNAGAGGAGGYREFALHPWVVGTYAITIGAGGSGSYNGNGSTVSQSVGSGFATISSTGGGEGGGWNTGVPQAGGSGGGGAGSGPYAPWSTAGAGNAGGYSPVEGYAGGQELTTWNGNSSGGGGAGGTPTVQLDGSGNPGHGGIGRYNNWQTGSNIGYGGGGGGGAGNGNQANQTVIYGGGAGYAPGHVWNANGAANRGGGAGGRAGYTTAGLDNGGSGVVIIRYVV